MKKKGMADVLAFGLVLTLALIVAGAAYIWLDKGGFSQLGAIKSTSGESVSECTGGNTQSFLIKGVDKETGAANTDNFSYRVLPGTAWTEGTLGTAITAGINPGDDIEVVVGPSPTSEQGDSYGPHFIVENVPCRFSDEVEVAADTLYSDMSGTFYNSDNNAAALTASAATSYIVHLKVRAANNEYAGNPYGPVQYPNVGCVNLNSTNMDKPDWVKVNGVSMNRVSAPTVHSGESTHVTYCYELPVFDESETWIDISLNTDDTYAPAEDDNFAIYSGSYYIHSETGDLEFGVETDDGLFVQFTAAETIALDLTP